VSTWCKTQGIYPIDRRGKCFKLERLPIETRPLAGTVVDFETVVAPCHIRIGSPAEQIQWVKREPDLEIPVGFPSMVMLLDEHPITVDGQSVWSVEHFTPYPNVPIFTPLVR